MTSLDFSNWTCDICGVEKHVKNLGGVRDSTMDKHICGKCYNAGHNMDEVY